MLEHLAHNVTARTTNDRLQDDVDIGMCSGRSGGKDTMHPPGSWIVIGLIECC
jgi:hypothetical protein